MSKENNTRFILLVRLTAIITFIAGSIIFTILGEKGSAMLLLGSAATGFSTLSGSHPQNPPGHGGQGDDSGGSGGGDGGPRIPGSGVVEKRRNPTIIKGISSSLRSLFHRRSFKMEILAVIIMFLIMFALNMKI